MADDATDLQIEITTSADLSGAEDTKTALEGVGEAATSAGEAVDGADKSWEQLNEENARLNEEGRAGFDSVKGGAEEADEPAQHVGGSMRGLRKAINAVHHESPIMGAALHAALHPHIALIIGLVEAFKLFKESMEEAKKVMEAYSGAELKPVEDALWKQQTAANAVTKSFHDFEAELKRIEADEKSVKTELQEATEAIKEQAKESAELSKLRESLAIAEVNARRGRGLSEAEADKQILAIKKKGIEDREEIDLAAATREINLKIDTMNKLVETTKEGHAELLKLEEQFQRDKAAVEKKKILEEEIKGAVEEQKKKVKVLEEAYFGHEAEAMVGSSPLASLIRGEGVGGGGKTGLERLSEADRTQLDESKALLRSYQEALKKTRASELRSERAIEETEPEIKARQKRLREDTQLSKTLEEQIPVDTEKLKHKVEFEGEKAGLQIAELSVATGTAVVKAIDKTAKTELASKEHLLSEAQRLLKEQSAKGPIETGHKLVAAAIKDHSQALIDLVRANNSDVVKTINSLKQDVRRLEQAQKAERNDAK